MDYKEIVKRVADNLGMSDKLVDRIYKAYWKSVKNHIVSLPLKEDLTDEEFSKLRPNINIPSVGKLHVTLDRYKMLKNYHNKITNKNQE